MKCVLLLISYQFHKYLEKDSRMNKKKVRLRYITISKNSSFVSIEHLIFFIIHFVFETFAENNK